MVKPGILFFLFILIFQIGNAQKYLNVKGSITDSSGIPLPDATVRITTSKDTLFAVTGENGRFNFRRIQEREFKLLITLTGYTTYMNEFAVDSAISIFQLKPIVLKVAYTELEKVNVMAIKPIVVKEDTVEYRASAFAVKTGAELEDLLKKLPGMWVDMNGNITVLGKKIEGLLVNGKSFFGGDMQIALQNLPADIVDKVQVINDYGDQAKLTGIKTGEPSKILNIELKKDKRNGEFGNILASTGTKERYTGNTFINAFSNDRQLSAAAGLNNNNETGASPGNTRTHSAKLNYSDQWNPSWSGNADFTLSGQNQNQQSNVSEEAYLADQKGFAQNNSSNFNKALNFQSHYTIQYQSKSSTILRLQPSLSIQHNNVTSLTTFSTLQQDSSFQKSSTGISSREANANILSTGSSLYYQKVDSKTMRRLSINVNYNYSQNLLTGNNINRSNNLINNIGDSSFQNYVLKNGSYMADLGVALNYYEPIGKKSFLELGYSFHRMINHENRDTRTPDSASGALKIIDSLSTNFDIQSTTQVFNIAYVSAINKLSINLSNNVQPNNLRTQYPGKGINSSYSSINYTPAVQLAYSFSATQRFSLSYSGNMNQPSPYQLQPVPDIRNSQFPIEGNPSLKPEFAHSLATQYEHSYNRVNKYYGFSVGLHFTETENKIITNLIHPHDNSPIIQKTTYLNANGFNSFTANLHFDLPALFNNSVRLSTGSELGGIHSLSMTDSVGYHISNLNYTQNLNVRYLLRDLLELDCNFNYSLNTIHYKEGTNAPGQSSAFSFRVECKANLPGEWVAGSNFSQSFMSGINQPLQANPALLNAYIQKMLMKGNRITLKLAGYDMLNGSTGVNRYVTPNSITRINVNLIGRYVLFSALFKFSRFHK